MSHELSRHRTLTGAQRSYNATVSLQRMWDKRILERAGIPAEPPAEDVYAIREVEPSRAGRFAVVWIDPTVPYVGNDSK